jgi:[ribosomal protein S5]-alanine N-acetyltransferase
MKATKGPELIETSRLLLRPPALADAAAIFECYASDPEVTRYVGWPTHTTLAETETFLSFSLDQWQQWPAGPYLICRRSDRAIIGGTGLAFESPSVASTGYVLTKSAWGLGYATEALSAMVTLAAGLGVEILYALCHAEHRASRHVLEKCAFKRDETYSHRTEFPNLLPRRPATVLRYTRTPSA